MAEIPEGAQRSEDGHYWWDGEQWQPVDTATAATGEIWFDPNQFPVLMAIVQAGDAETWLRSIGLDPEELAAAGSSPNLS